MIIRTERKNNKITMFAIQAVFLFSNLIDIVGDKYQASTYCKISQGDTEDLICDTNL